MSLLNELLLLKQADNRTDQRSSFESLLTGDDNLLKLAKEALDTETDWDEVWKIVSDEKICKGVLEFYGSHKNSAGMGLDSGFLLGQWLGIPAAAATAFCALQSDFDSLAIWLPRALTHLGRKEPRHKLDIFSSMGLKSNVASFDGRKLTEHPTEYALDLLEGCYQKLKEHNPDCNIAATRDLCRFILEGSTREIKHKCETHVLFARDGTGHVATLLAEVFDGHGECYFHPEKHALLPMGKEFTDAIRTTWNVACKQEGLLFDPKNHDIRWRVTGQNLLSLDGPSMGLASAITFTQSLRKGYLDKDIAITGAIDENEVISEVKSVEEKSRAAFDKGKKMLVCVGNFSDAETVCRERGLEPKGWILQADTFTKAIHLAGGVIGGMCDYFTKMQRLPDERLPSYFEGRKLTELYVRPDFLKYEIVEKKPDEDEKTMEASLEREQPEPQKKKEKSDLEAIEAEQFFARLGKVEKRISWEEGWKVLSQSSNRSVIIGPPGAGKSLLTRMIAAETAKKAIQKIEERVKIEDIPICISISLLELVVDSKISEEKELLEYLILILTGENYKIEKPAACFLVNQLPKGGMLNLDALDEVPKGFFDKLFQILGLLSKWKCSIVITGRPYGYEERRTELSKVFGDLIEFSMAPLNDTQQVQLIRNWFGESERAKGQTLIELRRTADHVGRMADNPFLLISLCALQNKEKIPNDINRAGLYEKIIRLMIDKELTGTRFGILNKCLEDIAFAMFRTRKEGFMLPFEEVLDALEGTHSVTKANANSREGVKAREEANKYFEELLGYRLLVRVGAKPGFVTFSHKSLGEFFCACHARRALEKKGKKRAKKVEKWIDRKVWLPDWNEVFLFLTGMLDKPEVIFRLLICQENDDIGRTRFSFAMRCLNELSESRQDENKRLIDEITAQWITLFDEAKPNFLKFAINKTFELGNQSFELSKFDYARYTKYHMLCCLTKLLLSDSHDRSQAAAYTLEKIGQKSVLFLTEYIEANNPQHQYKIFDLIRKIKKNNLSQSSEKPDALLSDRSQNQQKDVKRILSRSYSELILDLKSISVDARYNAVRLLGNYPSKASEVLPYLSIALNDANYDVVFQAVTSISKIAQVSAQAIKVLIENIKHTNFFVRDLVMEEIGKIGEKASDAIPLLKDFLLHDEQRLRLKATEAIKKMKDHAFSILPFLVEYINHPEYDVREKTVQSLSIFGKIAIPILLDALKNPEAKIRRRLIMVLDRMGEEATPAIPRLIDLVQNDIDIVSGYAAEVLGKIGHTSNKTLTVLIDILKDHNKDTYTRQQAARAISNFPDISGLAFISLVRMLNDKNPEVKNAIAESIEKINISELNLISISPQVRNSLRRALSDNSSLVRACAAKLIGRFDIESSEMFLSLVEDFEHKSNFERMSIAIGIGEFGKTIKNTIPQLLPILRDKDSLIRKAFVLSLAKIGSGATCLLFKALGDKDQEVRREAVNAIYSLEQDDSTLQILEENLQNEHFLARLTACQQLAKAGKKGVASISKLSNLLGSDEEATVRLNAAVSIGIIGIKSPEKVVSHTIYGLKDNDARVRDKVTNILANAGEKAPLSVFSYLAQNFAELFEKDVYRLNNLISRLYAVSTYRLFRLPNKKVVAIDVANPEDLARLAKLRLEPQ